MPTAYRIVPQEELHAAVHAILPFPPDITPTDYLWEYPPLDLLAHHHGVEVKIYHKADLEDFEDYHPLLAQNVSYRDALRLQEALKDLPCEVEIVPTGQ